MGSPQHNPNIEMQVFADGNASHGDPEQDDPQDQAKVPGPHILGLEQFDGQGALKKAPWVVQPTDQGVTNTGGDGGNVQPLGFFANNQMGRTVQPAISKGCTVNASLKDWVSLKKGQVP